MKKVIFSILIIFVLLTQVVFAQDKVTSVNYDASAGMIFLGLGAQVTENSQIKPVKLSNPNRIYFDIPNTVLTAGKQDFQISSGGDLKQIVVSQNSTNPDIVRVVAYFSENYKTDKMKLMRLKSGYIVVFNDQICKDANYMQMIYRDDKSDPSDYYSFISMVSQSVNSEEKPVNQVSTSEKVISQIQLAFENSTVPVNIKTSYQNTNVNVIKKDFKLKTKYFLNGISIKQNGFLINGFGVVSIEKPMKLTNPTRLVLDFPNTLSNPALRTKTFTYGNDTIKLGQFEANKTRLVIMTDSPDKYIPVYSADMQSVLIADKENLSHDKLTNIMTNLVDTKVTKVDSKNYGLNFYFSKPAVYSVKRDDSKLTIYFFNAVQYNDQVFKSRIRGTELSSSKIDLMPRIGLRYSIPLNNRENVKIYDGADSRTVKISIKAPEKPVEKEKPQDKQDKSQTKDEVTKRNSGEEPVLNDKGKLIDKILKRKPGEKVVVLDPGHGGIDYGAIRSGINEKDITTDVSNRVAAILRSQGYTVYMTRSEDKTLSLQERVDFAEENSPDIFVSIHVNSSQGTTATGIETHYYHDYSIDLAKVVHAGMVKYINSKDRGLFKSKFYVINHTTMPAILVEIGFISNDEERADLISEKRKQATAKGIAEGITNYYKQQQQQKK